MTRRTCTGPDWTDDTAARRHLHALRAAGMRIDDIWTDAGVSRTLVTDLLYGRRDRTTIGRILAANAAAILAVTPRIDRALLPPHGTRRRIAALAALGWSFADQERACGISRRRLTNMAQGRTATLGIRPETAARVAAMYDELSMRVGPSAYARTVAARYGWQPPLALDDERIDDPDYRPEHPVAADDTPDPIAVDRFIAGDLPWDRLTRAERIQAARVMDSYGYPRKVIRARTHLNTDALRAAFGRDQEAS